MIIKIDISEHSLSYVRARDEVSCVPFLRSISFATDSFHFNFVVVLFDVEHISRNNAVGALHAMKMNLI